LITIWEPRAYPVLLSFLAQGISCPRKVLINSDIELLDVPNIDALMNVNTPEERALIELKIEARTSVTQL
jgi:molybdenum cofactor guanylyltransferase